MPSVRRNGIDLHYVERGDGAQTVVFSHSFLVDHRQFDAQIEALSDRFRVVAYDHRDHGQSARATEPYAMSDLVADAVAVIEATKAAPCHFVGLSTGGFVGTRLALWHRDLLRSLVLMDTSGRDESLFNRIRYGAMLLVLRAFGTRPLIGEAMRSMFGRSALADPKLEATMQLWRERILENDGRALARFATAIFARDDVLERLRGVDLPTLVVVGEEDRPLPVDKARALADAIPDAQFEMIPGAGHLNTIEKPEVVNAILRSFLDRVS